MTDTIFDREARRLMIAHELAHLSRRDLVWIWLSALTHLLFFFHPLVWLARREEDLACEMDCDLLAVEATHAPIARYGALIVAAMTTGTATLQQKPYSIAALGISKDVSNIRQRLMALRKIYVPMSKQSLRLLVSVASVVTAGALIPWRVIAANDAKTAPAQQQVKPAIPHDKQFPGLLLLSGGTGSIEGRITIDPRQSPGRNYLINLRQAGASGAPFRLPSFLRSDINGHYRIDHVPAGKYIVSAWPMDNSERISALHGDGNLLVVIGEGQHIVNPDLRFLTKSVTVFGRISDSKTGQPVTNVRVVGFSQTASERGAQLWSQVDHDGSYEVHVPPGKSGVMVQYAGDSYPPARTDIPFRVPKSAGAFTRLVDARLGHSIKLDIPVPTERAQPRRGSLPPIMGCVLDASGKPVPGADVDFFCESKIGDYYRWVIVRTDAAGQFRWEGLWPKWEGTEFDIRARDNRAAGLVSQPMRVTLPQGGLTQPLTLRLQPNLAASVTGRVLDDKGRPVADARVILDAAKGIVKLSETILTDSQGRYTFTGIWPDMVVRLSATEDGYGAGATPVDGGLALKTGERHEMQPLIIERVDHSIAGTVVTSKGAAAAGQFINIGANRGFYARTMTDSQGRFRVDGVPGGRLLLYYSGDIPPMPVQAGDMRVKIVYDWKPWKAKK